MLAIQIQAYGGSDDLRLNDLMMSMLGRWWRSPTLGSIFFARPYLVD